MTTFDDSMHCGPIKRDTTEAIPQSCRRMTDFGKSTNNNNKKKNRNNTYKLHGHMSSSSSSQ